MEHPCTDAACKGNGAAGPANKETIRASLKTYLNAENLFFLSLIMITAGLATSNILMSWGQFGLAFAWLWQRDYRRQWNRFITQPQLVMHAGIFLLFVGGLIHTSDFGYGFHDLKIKLPLLLLPFLIGGFPFSDSRRATWILHALLLTLLFCCATGVLIYLRILPWKADDVRKFSPFISSIRLSTLLVFGIFACGWLLFPSRREWRLLPRLFYAVSIVFFLGFIVLLKSLTGIIALLGAAWVLLLVWAFRKKKPFVRFSVTAAALLLPLFIFLYVRSQIRDFYRVEKVDFSELQMSTPDGTYYKHDTTSWQLENGHYVYLYIANWELKQEWNRRSAVDFDGFTTNGWPIRETLIRFITSKGWKKNAGSVQKLTDDEIRAIEKGITNYRYMYPLRISSRIYQVIWEYNEYIHTGDPNGKSLATRLEFWKHGWSAVMRAPITGYGTGDTRKVLRDELQSASSKLDRAHWGNPHQQYLSVALATGFAGLLIFLVLFIGPFAITPRLHVLQWVLLSISLIAMLDDDPLETQAGVTQLSLLFCLLFSVFPLNSTGRKKTNG